MGDRHGLLVQEAHRQIEVVLADTSIAQRPVDTPRGRVHEDRNIERHRPLPQGIECWLVEVDTEVGSDVRTHEAVLLHRAREFFARRRHVLHRQLSEAAEAIGMRGNDLGHLVVVPLAEVASEVGFDVVEVGERVG